VEEFTYLGNRFTTIGDCDKEFDIRIGKANHTFAMSRPIWRFTIVSIHTKIRIFYSNILIVQLYGTDCLKIPVAIEEKVFPIYLSAEYEDILA
jgi:hypothetical protein